MKLHGYRLAFSVLLLFAAVLSFAFDFIRGVLGAWLGMEELLPFCVTLIPLPWGTLWHATVALYKYKQTTERQRTKSI